MNAVMVASVEERIGIVETKVENINEKIDDLRIDVKDMHDCLDNTRDGLQKQLEKMYDASCEQHGELAEKISSLEKQRDKWIWSVAGGLVVLSWLTAHSETILNFISKS
jgi:phosphate uptake regulator